MKTYQEFIAEAKGWDELPIVTKTVKGTLKDFKTLPSRINYKNLLLLFLRRAMRSLSLLVAQLISRNF